MMTLPKSQRKVSARRQIQIRAIRNDQIVLANKTACIVLAVSTVNFELKSDGEQDVLIESFQHFLNALPCPIQIVIRTRALSVETYLAHITTQCQNETNPIYQRQLHYYTDFVRSLIADNTILSRHFYLVIPSSPNTKDVSITKAQLATAKDIVLKGLAKMGMKAEQLPTESLCQLFYQSYNAASLTTQDLAPATIREVIQYGSTSL